MLLPAGVENRLAVKQELSTGGTVQAHEHVAHGTLPAAGLPHQAQGLTGVNVKTDAIHCVEHGALLLALKVFFQVLHFHQRRSFFITHGSAPPCIIK